MKHTRQLISIIVGIVWLSTLGLHPAAAKPELKTARTVSVQYYLSLPAGWNPSTKWPIVVALDGSGHWFADNSQRFSVARGDRPFIIVTPCVKSNGNDPADMPAVLSIVKEVQAEDSGQDKFFLTGFSAGGHTAWQIIFSHPELLAGVALSAGNYLGRGVTSISDAPERAQLPIQEFQGDHDPYIVRLTEQWNDAEQTARAHGYQNLTHTLVPGGTHQRFQAQVMDYFAGLLPTTSSAH